MNDQKLKNWFQRHKVITGIVIVVILLGIGGAIGQSDTSTVNKPAATTSSTKPSNASSTPSDTSQTAHVGATLSLKDEDNNKEDITLVKVVDPAHGDDEFTNPDGGKRFVGLQFKITNTGTNPIGQEADNDATIIDSTNQSYNDDVSSLGDCPEFADSGNIAPGESLLGCVTFQLPINATIAKVHFTPSSGFADDTGSWLVP